VDFVYQSGAQALLGGVRATYYHDLFVARGRLRLRNRACDAIGNKCNGQLAVYAFGRLVRGAVG
jgi:hypothetical protein